MLKIFILKKRKDFLRAAKGFKMVYPSLILLAAQSLSSKYRTIDDKSCYLGYTATKKLGKAFVRNRTKRRLRAAAREIFPKQALAGTDYVLIGRYNTKDIPFHQLKNDMEKALKRINLLIAEKPSSETEKKRNDEEVNHSEH